MAVDMFLAIKDVKGEAHDKAHKEEIDVLAWSWGVSQSGTMHVGGGGGGGKADFQDISVTKWIDKASATLMRMCATGEHIPDATLTVRKAGKSPLEYLVLKMYEILVTSVSTGGSGGEDRLTENITLNFAKIDVTYKDQKADGTAGKTFESKFNIAEQDYS
jgi:type VI secretion system secreted protein Hcp